MPFLILAILVGVETYGILQAMKLIVVAAMLLRAVGSVLAASRRSAAARASIGARAVATVIGLAALLTFAAAPSDAQSGGPTIVFEVVHADCSYGFGTNTISFYVNDVLLGVEPTQTACTCGNVSKEISKAG